MPLIILSPEQKTELEKALNESLQWWEKTKHNLGRVEFLMENTAPDERNAVTAIYTVFRKRFGYMMDAACELKEKANNNTLTEEDVVSLKSLFEKTSRSEFSEIIQSIGREIIYPAILKFSDAELEEKGFKRLQVDYVIDTQDENNKFTSENYIANPRNYSLHALDTFMNICSKNIERAPRTP